MKTTIEYENGIRYKGQVQNNIPHGKGTLRDPDGVCYQGNFVEGIMHGKGTMFFPDGGLCKGVFRNGKPQGWTIFTNEDGTEFGVEIEDGVAIGDTYRRLPDHE